MALVGLTEAARLTGKHPTTILRSLSGRSPAKEFMDLREIGDDPVIIDVTNDHVQVIAQAKPTWIPWDFFRSEASCNAFVAIAAKARKDANRALQNSLDKYK